MALAGHWLVEQQKISAKFTHFSGQAGVADLQLQAKHQLELSCSAPTLLLYVIQGRITVGKTTVKAGYLAQLSPGERLLMNAPSVDARVLCLYGIPIGESIVHQGPFVMNSQQELQDTIAAYQAGKLGVLN